MRPENNPNYYGKTYFGIDKSDGVDFTRVFVEVDLKNDITINKKDLIKSQLDFIEKEKAKLEKQLEELEKKKWPKDGDKYWIPERRIDGTGLCNLKWKVSPQDISLKQLGLISPTAEGAQLIHDRMVARTAVIKKIKELNDGWKPDWRNDKQEKIFLLYDHQKDRFDHDCSWTYQYQSDELMMKNEEVKGKVLNNFDLKTLKLAYGVE